MVEYNLIEEGFMFNTLAPGGSISGTQSVSIPEMNSLVDGNITSTAITITGSESILLDADLGARWKLQQIQLYTSESNSSNFNMSVSEDGLSFYALTMTGSVGLWSSTVSGTTVSGAPRYLRYEHNPPIDTVVREWRAINDDTLVDFGVDGTQIEVEISDSPIGRPSDSITTLPLFNRFSKTAQGFIFIDNTGNKGDDNIEISLSASGPWFGRETQTARQPDNTPWIRVDSFKGLTSGDIFFGTSINDYTSGVVLVTGTAYKTDFTSGTAKGWSATGYTSTTVTAGTFKGNTSTTTSPTLHINNDFGNNIATSPDAVSDISNNFVPFRASHYNTVEITLTNSYIDSSDFQEGVRLFWRDHNPSSYITVRSTLSTTPGANYTGIPQKFTFDVGSVTTWSGTIRSLSIQPFTTATGLGYTTTLNSLEVFNGDRRDRLVLQDDTTINGQFISINGGTATAFNTYRTVINTENTIKEPCIITSVSALVRPGPDADESGWFLARFADDFTYQDTADSVNAATDPFEVVHRVATDESEADNTALFVRQPVFWSAQPGDMLGYGYRITTGLQGAVFSRDSSLTHTVSGCLTTTSTSRIGGSSTIQDLEDDLNAATWSTAGERYNIQFRSISAGKYLTEGTYNTPIFDGGGDPALLSFEFESVEENGTKVDIDGSAAFDAANARASSVPPNTARALGRNVQQFMLGAHPADTPSRYDSKYTSNYIIGLLNPEVAARESVTAVENVIGQILYHEQKQELWALNLVLSGSVSTELRPNWDAYDLETGSYIRTDHVKGNITYFHANDGAGVVGSVFEPVGWVADYDRSEIYIISREDEFSISNAKYNGMILDLDGNFKNLFWRNSQLTADIVAAGVKNTASEADILLTNMRTVAYRNGYFFAITRPETSSTDRGTHLNVYRLGNNPLDPENPNDVEFINQVDLTGVPGLSFISTSRPVETFTYCSENDLFYFTVSSPNTIYTMTITQAGVTPNETFTVNQGPISESVLDQIQGLGTMLEGFSSSTAGSLNDWDGVGTNQALRHFGGWCYCKDRDTFPLFLHVRSNRSVDFIREGDFGPDDLWKYKNHSLVVEISAETRGKLINTPRQANQKDVLWGTLSGTLGYEVVQKDSILFPTGRYAQLSYKLQSDSSRLHSPQLIESSVTQGLKISNIPPSGTKNIYLRTNLDDSETIGDQSGRLKVFWELQEN